MSTMDNANTAGSLDQLVTTAFDGVSKADCLIAAVQAAELTLRFKGYVEGAPQLSASAYERLPSKPPALVPGLVTAGQPTLNHRIMYLVAMRLDALSDSEARQMPNPELREAARYWCRFAERLRSAEQAWATASDPTAALNCFHRCQYYANEWTVRERSGLPDDPVSALDIVLAALVAYFEKRMQDLVAEAAAAVLTGAVPGSELRSVLEQQGQIDALMIGAGRMIGDRLQ